MVACSAGNDAVTSMLSAVKSLPCKCPLVRTTSALPVAEAAKVPETGPLPKAARLTMSPRSMSIDAESFGVAAVSPMSSDESEKLLIVSAGTCHCRARQSM